jgi:protein-tyrosine phosphatase
MSEGWVRTSESHPIRVDQLPADEVHAPGRLGMTFAPGMWAEALGGRWERDLAADIKTLTEEYGTEMLVSLMENEEYLYYGVPELLEESGYKGIEVLRFPIRDMGVPLDAESEEFASFVGEVVKRLEAGKNVVAHCRGGLGRTGMVVACVLVALGGHTADEAIGAVRKARRGTVQTEEQAEFVRQYELKQRLA